MVCDAVLGPEGACRRDVACGDQRRDAVQTADPPYPCGRRGLRLAGRIHVRDVDAIFIQAMKAWDVLIGELRDDEQTDVSVEEAIHPAVG